MENLLSLAFDNLSSYDGPKVRKGLRQVESLLANICLTRDKRPGDRDRQHHRNRSSTGSVVMGGHPLDPASADDDMYDENEEDDGETPPSSAVPPKTLGELSDDDPAFHTFFRLQEGFEWNVALRLVNTLDRLLARGADGSNDLLILSALDLLQGTLLLHPPSKSLFSREMYMNLLLDLLEPDFCPAIQSATVVTLVTALLDAPQNTRTFENLDGLLTITSLFRSRGTSRDVKLKLVEFLYVYLMPEVPSIPSASHHDSGMSELLQRSPSKLAKAFSVSSRGGDSVNSSMSRSRSDSLVETRSQEEKQELLGRHLNSSVDQLVQDLRHCMPFGGVVC